MITMSQKLVFPHMIECDRATKGGSTRTPVSPNGAGKGRRIRARSIIRSRPPWRPRGPTRTRSATDTRADDGVKGFNGFSGSADSIG
jgi:hypothetical protein